MPLDFLLFSIMLILVKAKYFYFFRNVKFSGKMRVVMNPTMSQLPFIGGVQIMFLNPPEIDFDFEGAARLASKLPIVKTKIKSELLEDMGKEIIFPNRLTLPLSWTADPELVWHG